MTYIFEDCKDAPLCKAFNNCYSSEVQKMFIYIQMDAQE